MTRNVKLLNKQIMFTMFESKDFTKNLKFECAKNQFFEHAEIEQIQ